MAIAFINGEITRTFLRAEGDNPFFACTVKETYTDRNGEVRNGGYHNVVAFGEEALELGVVDEGDTVDLQTRISYRPDERFTDENDKHPYQASFIVQKVNRVTRADAAEIDDDEDPFA